jgi:hypothetical protein
MFSITVDEELCKMDVVKLTENTYQVSIISNDYSIKVTLNNILIPKESSSDLLISKTNISIDCQWAVIYQTYFNLKNYGYATVIVEGYSHQPEFLNDIPVKNLPYTHTYYTSSDINQIVAAFIKICSMIDKEKSCINSTGHYARYVDYDKEKPIEDTNAYTEEANLIKSTNPITFKSWK